jgi:predicted Fe-Mo cluster-binding NifX family protein
MNVAVTAQGTELDSPVEPRLGRARYFLLADLETGRFRVHDNSQNAEAASGAGVQTAQSLVNLGAEAVLTGIAGPKALATLQAAGISVHVGAEGTVAQALEAFRAGRLPNANR